MEEFQLHVFWSELTRMFCYTDSDMKTEIFHVLAQYSRTSMARILRDHENMFGTGLVRANLCNDSAKSRGIIGIYFQVLT